MKNKTERVEKETKGRNYLKMIPGLLLVIIGLFILWVGKTNPIVILIGAAIAAGGGLLFWNGWQQGSVRMVNGGALGNKKKVVSETPPNTLVLRPGINGDANEISFEYMENPPGHKKKCRNNNTWWYVMIQKNTTDKTLIEHQLPDNSDSAIYCNPGILAQALSMTANKRLFEYSPDNLAKVSLVIMGIIVAGEIIGLIAMSGNNETVKAAAFLLMKLV